MSATAATRDSSSAPEGTENDSSPSRLRARVSRAAIVACDTRNNRAMSEVLTPSTRRRVIAAALSGASAGWAHSSTSRSRSSTTGSPTSAITRCASSVRCASTASSGSLRPATASERRRSMIRCRAVVSSHAVGLSGTPCGQVRAAASKASPRPSSARSSRRYCATSRATRRAHSLRRTRSTSVSRRPRCPRRAAACAPRCRPRRPGCRSSRAGRRGCRSPRGRSRSAAPRLRRTGRR